MIRTNLSIEKVPATWIFEHYCKLDQRLHGQDVKILSIFNPDDKIPSMAISFMNGRYIYKDFSTGYGGDAVSLVARIHNIPYNQAISLIIDQYSSRKQDYELATIVEEDRFKVTSHTKRNWNVLDAGYWQSFHIGSEWLGKYRVVPLREYYMTKDTPEGPVTVHIKGNYIYGYFKANGELYKIYQPYREEHKFIKVSEYIQGSEQLTYTKSTLIISSSLKDIGSLDALSLDVESIAPDSENSLIPKPMLTAWALKYDRILTLFDNDAPGHKAMEKYKNTYGIPGIYLNLAKDLSDSVKEFGVSKTRTPLNSLINSR